MNSRFMIKKKCGIKNNCSVNELVYSAFAHSMKSRFRSWLSTKQEEMASSSLMSLPDITMYSGRRSASSSCSLRTVVPAFSIRSCQSGILVQKPPRINVFAERPTPSVAFRRIYERGDLPVRIVHESRHYRLGWKVMLILFFLFFLFSFFLIFLIFFFFFFFF